MAGGTEIGADPAADAPQGFPVPEGTVEHFLELRRQLVRVPEGPLDPLFRVAEGRGQFPPVPLLRFGEEGLRFADEFLSAFRQRCDDVAVSQVGHENVQAFRGVR